LRFSGEDARAEFSTAFFPSGAVRQGGVNPDSLRCDELAMELRIKLFECGDAVQVIEGNPWQPTAVHAKASHVWTHAPVFLLPPRPEQIVGASGRASMLVVSKRRTRAPNVTLGIYAQAVTAHKRQAQERLARTVLQGASAEVALG